MNKTIRVARASGAVLLAITLSACVTQLGRDFNEAYAEQIKPGETTKAEIRRALGRPVAVDRGSEEDIWTYAYYKGSGVIFEFGTGTGQQKRLVVKFSGEKVKEAKFNRELPIPDPLEEAYR